MGDSPFSPDRRQLLQTLGALLLATACCPTPLPCPKDGSKAKANVPVPQGPLVVAPPESVGMSADRLNDVFARLERRVSDDLFPGFTAMVVRHGKIVGQAAFGKKARSGNEPMTLDTIFDLESMSKVVATAIAAIVLVERGKLKLDDTVVRWLPDFTGPGKDAVTVRDMLRYSAGLPIDNQFFDMPAEEIWRKMAQTPLASPPGKTVEYSDLTYRLLGRVIESASGTRLDVFCRENIWTPLGMTDTMYNPPKEIWPRVAATGPNLRRKDILRGVVQDDQDFELGGVVGCDGVFSTAKDLAVFAQMLLAGGIYNGKRILSEELTVALVSNQTPFVDKAHTDTSQLTNLLSTPKGYGFEISTQRFSPVGMRFSQNSYGKTGGAGTFMWVDPQRMLFGILLTNHGLPVPFDEPGWDKMLQHVGPNEFFDGLINAITDE